MIRACLAILSSFFLYNSLIAQTTTVDSKRFHQSVDWAPDGYSVTYDRFESGKWSVYVYTIADNLERRITDTSISAKWPSFSPDGEQIVFAGAQSNNTDIYLTSLKSANTARLTLHDSTDTQPSWNLDGKSLLFISTRDGNEEIYSFQLADKREKRLTHTERSESNPVALPNGVYAMFFARVAENNDDIFVISLNDQVSQALFAAEGIQAFPASVYATTDILFMSLYESKRGIFRADSAGGNIREIIPNAFFARVSHDGNHIAYIDGSWPSSDIHIAPIDSLDVSRCITCKK